MDSAAVLGTLVTVPKCSYSGFDALEENNVALEAIGLSYEPHH